MTIAKFTGDPAILIATKEPDWPGPVVIPTATGPAYPLPIESTWPDPEPKGVLPVVYGHRRIHGQMVAGILNDWFSGQGSFVICEGPINAVLNCWIGPWKLSASNTLITTTNYLGASTQTPRPCTAWVKIHVSASSNGSSPGWQYSLPETGFSDVEFEIEGLKLKDPANPTNPETYSNNPAWVLRDFLTHPVHGCMVSEDLIDDDNFAAAATKFNTLGYTINTIISSETNVQNFIDMMRTACRAEIYFADGKYRIFIDDTQSTVVAAFESGRSDGADSSTVNCSNVKYSFADPTDMPTRVTVEFPDAAKNWESNTVTVEHPGLSENPPTVELLESSYKIDAITNAVQARQIAQYLLRFTGMGLLQVEFDTAWIGVKLGRGSLITLLTSDGLGTVGTPQTMIVNDTERNSDGTYHVYARQYDSDLYSTGSFTPDTPIETSLANPFEAPDPLADVVAWTKEIAVPGEPVTVDYWAGLQYTIPTDARADHIVVRGVNQVSGGAEPEWDDTDMEASEIRIPLTGNAPYGGGTTGYLYHPAVRAFVMIADFAPGSGYVGSSEYQVAHKIIARVASKHNVPSTEASDYVAASLSPELFIDTDVLDLPEVSDPTISDSGRGRIAFDATSHAPVWSQNGGAWTPFGGGSPTFPDQPANEVLAGPTSGADAAPAFRALVAADLPVMVGDTGSGGEVGAVPAPAAGDATKFLRGDGDWADPAGGGTGFTVVTPSGTVDGSNKTFTLTEPDGDYIVMADGEVLIPTNDYTLSSGTLTIVSGRAAPTQWIIVLAAGVGGGGVASPLTTPGDLWGWDTANARIPVGSDGKVLSADSSLSLGVGYKGGLVQIAQVVTTGSQATVDFDNIPSYFNDLLITFQVRSNLVGSYETMSMKVNNDGTAANYSSSQYLGGATSSAYAGNTAASTSGWGAGGVGGTTSPTGYASTGQIMVFNYARTTFYKCLESLNRYDQAANTLNEIHSGHWKSTAAVSRLTLSVPTSFVDGSVITLYGLGSNA